MECVKDVMKMEETMNNFKFFQKEKEIIKWRTKHNQQIEISDLETDHIMNIIHCLCEDNIIPDPYFGRTRLQWYRIMQHEYFRRTR
jgi:hypothetical protein